jgi:hypothetical protein
MTTYQLEAIINKVATTINPSGSYFYGREFDLSNYHEDRRPQIHLAPIRKTVDPISNNVTLTCFVFFWIPTNQNEMQEGYNPALIESEDLSIAFLSALIQEPIQILSVNSTPEFHRLQGGFSGFGIQFDVLGKELC